MSEYDKVVEGASPITPICDGTSRIAEEITNESPVKDATGSSPVEAE